MSRGIVLGLLLEFGVHVRVRNPFDCIADPGADRKPFKGHLQNNTTRM